MLICLLSLVLCHACSKYRINQYKAGYFDACLLSFLYSVDKFQTCSLFPL